MPLIHPFSASRPRISSGPVPVRFLSLEPLLGPLPSLDLAGIDWVIVGGESGSGFRPLDLDWVRDLRDRCLERNVRLFLKVLCTRDRACQSVRSLRSDAASGGSGGAAVWLDAVLAEQLAQPLELAVHSLVLLKTA
jgi:protein gp37